MNTEKYFITCYYYIVIFIIINIIIIVVVINIIIILLTITTTATIISIVVIISIIIITVAVLSYLVAKCFEIFIAENIKLMGEPFDLRGWEWKIWEKNFRQSLYSQKQNHVTRMAIKKCMHSFKNIAYTTGQWDKIVALTNFSTLPLKV